MLESLAVFAFVDGLGLGADHFNAEAFERTVAVQRHGGVQCGLATERRKENEFIGEGGCQTRGAFGCARGGRAPLHQINRHAQPLHLLQFTHDDFFHGFGRDRLDISAVCELRVGHDGGRVGVHQHDAVALLLEGLAGLRAGIIEFARLADNDRPGADDQDGVNVSALGHL